jgi:hypothetical protein
MEFFYLWQIKGFIRLQSIRWDDDGFKDRFALLSVTQQWQPHRYQKISSQFFYMGSCYTKTVKIIIGFIARTVVDANASEAG